MAKANEIEIRKIEGMMVLECYNLNAQIKELQEQEKDLKKRLSEIAMVKDGSLKLEDVTGAIATITKSLKTSYDQEKLCTILESHPVIAKEYFCKEWKPVDQKVIERKLENTGSGIWKDIKEAMKKSEVETIRLKGAK